MDNMSNNKTVKVQTEIRWDKGATLKEYDDTNLSLLPKENSDTIISLCSVEEDYFTGEKWLRRHADLGGDGMYHLFHQDETRNSIFDNRGKTFFNDGPNRPGFYGIWNWKVEPNRKDPSKNYISSHYNENINPIEIVIVQKANSLDSLVQTLKDGIKQKIHSQRIMFTYRHTVNSYLGILLDSKDLRCFDDKNIITFNPEITSAPVYEMLSKDIVSFGTSVCFSRKAFAGVPIQLYYLKNQLNIVRDIVLSSVSWATYKKSKITRKENQKFREFLEYIPLDDVMNKIEREFHCSDSEARKFIDDFLGKAEMFADGKTIEDEIILTAIAGNMELQERTKELLRADWEKENADRVKELKAVTESLAEVRENIDKFSHTEKQLVDSIDEKKAIANQLEEEIEAKIKEAKGNLTEFVASMTFLSACQSSEFKPKDQLLNSRNIYQRIHCAENSGKLFKHTTWEEASSAIAVNLEEAGVDESHSNGLAAFLLAAYNEKQPLLLVGPNAEAIVHGFCASLHPDGYGLLHCSGDYNEAVISKIGVDGEKNVIIKNIFGSGWMNHLPDMLARENIFYIVVHPYAEDVQVEPKSLYGFLLPLFTDFFVNSKPTGEYYCGYLDDSLTSVDLSEDERHNVKVLESLKMTPLARNRINEIVGVMNKILPDVTPDDEFLCAVLPIAYASLEMDALRRSLDNPNNGFAISQELKQELKQIIGEI